MTSREFAEWMAYDRLDPIGDERGDMNAGLVATMVANANRDPKKHPEPYRLKDCMLRFGLEPGADAKEEPASMLAKIKAVLSSVVKKQKG